MKAHWQTVRWLPFPGGRSGGGAPSTAGDAETRADLSGPECRPLLPPLGPYTGEQAAGPL